MHANGKDDGVGNSEAAAKLPDTDNLDTGNLETSKRVDVPLDSDLKLDDSAQLLIGQHLKAVYSEIVREPIPEQFLQLLDELERKERHQ
jgi:hypothetical protein